MGFGLLLMITLGFMGCNSTEGNTNMRNTNTNTGYLANNSNVSSPIPTSSPMKNSNMGDNAKSGMNANSNRGSNINSKTNNHGVRK